MSSQATSRRGNPTRFSSARLGQTPTSALTVPISNAAAISQLCSAKTSWRNWPGAEADGCQEAKFAAALEDIPRDDDRQPGTAQEQAEAAQGLENGQVGILDGLKLGETARGRRQFQPPIRQRSR